MPVIRRCGNLLKALCIEQCQEKGWKGCDEYTRAGCPNVSFTFLIDSIVLLVNKPVESM